MSDAQIAEELGCAETTVRGYLFRALRSLRVQQHDANAPIEIETEEQP